MKLFLIAAAVLFPMLPQTAGAGGSVGGVVTYAGNVPSPKIRPITVDAETCGQEAVSEDFVVGKKGALKNAVVYLEGPVLGGKPPAVPPRGFVVDQKNCRFNPHVIVVPKGFSLTFKNSDPIAHSFRTTGRTNPPQSRNQPRFMTETTLPFESPEIFEVKSDLHPWMSLWVVVAANPHYAVTGEDGRYRLEDVPAGDYNLVVWQELLGAKVRRITVREGEHLPFDIRLEKPAVRVSYEPDRIVDILPP